MPTYVNDGATTTHGGRVEASCGPEMNYYGKRPLRLGDGFFCPRCKCWSRFMGPGADVDRILFGKPALMDGAVATCGAVLRPNETRMIRDYGGQASSSTTTSSAFSNSRQSVSNDIFDEVFQIKTKNNEIMKNVKYIITRADGTEEKGITDENGLTHHITSGSQSEIVSIKISNDY